MNISACNPDAHLCWVLLENTHTASLIYPVFQPCLKQDLQMVFDNDNMTRCTQNGLSPASLPIQTATLSFPGHALPPPWSFPGLSQPRFIPTRRTSKTPKEAFSVMLPCITSQCFLPGSLRFLIDRELLEGKGHVSQSVHFPSPVQHQHQARHTGWGAWVMPVHLKKWFLLTIW